MAKGRVRKLLVVAAAIGSVIFFWRKRKSQDTFGAASSSTIDYGALGGTPGSSGASTPTGGPTTE